MVVLVDQDLETPVVGSAVVDLAALQVPVEGSTFTNFVHIPSIL